MVADLALLSCSIVLTVRFRFVEMELGWIPDFLKKTPAAGHP
jgi:hypothetical protein